MVIDWLAAGIDPSQATLFVQSRVPEHAELHLLLSMFTPLGWLERVPTYKDQQEKLAETRPRHLRLPRLSAAAGGRHPDVPRHRVPVGEDQVPHIELTREIARRFNHLFGRETGFEEKAAGGGQEAGRSKRASSTRELRTRFQEKGDDEALAQAQDAARRRAEPAHGRPRAAVRLPGGQRARSSCPSRGAAHRGVEAAGHRRPEDVQELRQRDRHARGPRCGHEEAAHDADRPRAGPAHRSGRTRTLPGLAAAPGLLGRGHAASGCRRAAAARASAASSASSR